MGTPSNIDEYTLKRLCAENGAFVRPVTIILLSHLTNIHSPFLCLLLLLCQLCTSLPIPASHHTTPICLLKTAIAPMISSDICMNASILFDEGTQCSISSHLAIKLNIVPSTTTQVALTTFSNDSSSFQTFRVATIQIWTLTRDVVPVSVLIVPRIAKPIQNFCQIKLDNLPYFKGLQIAHPITDSDEVICNNPDLGTFFLDPCHCQLTNCRYLCYCNLLLQLKRLTCNSYCQ